MQSNNFNPIANIAENYSPIKSFITDANKGLNKNTGVLSSISGFLSRNKDLASLLGMVGGLQILPNILERGYNYYNFNPETNARNKGIFAGSGGMDDFAQSMLRTKMMQVYSSLPIELKGKFEEYMKQHGITAQE